MNKQKLLSSVLAISLACTTFVTANSTIASAEEKNIPQETYFYSELANVGTIVDGGQVTIDGQTNNLYRVFADKNTAIADIKAKLPELLTTLSEQYNLADLSDSNWTEYRDAMFMMLDSATKPANYNESNEAFLSLRSFFDIYENSDKNDKILSEVRKLPVAKVNSTLNNMVSEDLALMLPYTEPFAQNYMQQKNAMTRAATYDVTKAINYANKYATSPNKPTYYYFSNGDCANFASQILENAGVSQIVYSDVAKGWWHKREKGFLGIGYKHTHSQSWSMADTFARYQGVVYSTTSHSQFMANISKGSFIVADFDKDGDWDHCGFVTDKKTGDYKVAQHTSNYNAWASTSTNSWDTGDGKYKYARVRM